MNKKIAIITGASRGIGKTVALELSQLHYHVILISRSEKSLALLKDEIEKNGNTADYYALDVACHEKVNSTINHIINKFHSIDLLFNNAGVLTKGTLEISSIDVEEMIKINLLGVIHVGNCVASHMKQQKNGYIINMSSMAGKRGVVSNGIYSASKFGVLGYSESLYKELLPYGIKVTAICPSTVATDMTQSFQFEPNLMIPTKDILKTILFLLSLDENTAIPEIMLQCSAFVIKETQTMLEKLLPKLVE